ncbi:RING-type domain-containing protein [Entamoeba marina]
MSLEANTIYSTRNDWIEEATSTTFKASIPIVFKTPFTNTPQVVVFLSGIDISSNCKFTLEADSITTRGFSASCTVTNCFLYGFGISYVAFEGFGDMLKFGKAYVSHSSVNLPIHSTYDMVVGIKGLTTNGVIDTEIVLNYKNSYVVSTVDKHLYYHQPYYQQYGYGQQYYYNNGNANYTTTEINIFFGTESNDKTVERIHKSPSTFAIPIITKISTRTKEVRLKTLPIPNQSGFITTTWVNDDITLNASLLIYNDKKGVVDQPQQTTTTNCQQIHLSNICPCCLESIANTVFLPCKHLVVCSECAISINQTTKKCPVCLQNVEEFINVKIA